MASVFKRGWEATKERSRRASKIVTHLAKHKRLTLSASTNDSEYEAGAAEFEEVAQQIERVYEAVTQYLQSTRALCVALNELGESFAGAVGTRDVDSDMGIAVKEYRNVMSSLDNTVRRSMDERCMEEVVETLQDKRKAVKVIRERMEERQSIKYEYDYYFEKVKKMKEKGMAEPERLPRNERKMEIARAPLELCTQELLRSFAQCRECRPDLLRYEFRTLRASQQQFFSSCAAATENFAGVADRGIGELPVPAPVDVASVRAQTEGQLASQPRVSGYRDRLIRFYSVHNPAKLGEVDTILAEYQGREDELFAALEAKYGPMPDIASPSTASTYSQAFSPAAGAAAAATSSAALSMASAPSAPPAPPNDFGASFSKPSSTNPFLPDLAAKPDPAGSKPDLFATPGTFAAPPAVPPPAQPAQPAQQGAQAVALFDYDATADDELTLRCGDRVTVLEKHDDGWWLGRAGDRQGVFPGNYCQQE